MGYAAIQAVDGMAFDTAWAVDAAVVAQIPSTPLLGQPVVGLAQYIGLHAPGGNPGNGPGDATRANLEAICDAGYGCWLVQHCPFGEKNLAGNDIGWPATSVIGKERGAAAKINALAVGYSVGCHIGLDLENVQQV